MQYSAWQSGSPVASPAYLDANVLVGAVVRGHPLYRTTAKLTGGLLASGVHILVSVLTVEESLWAMAKLSYCELHNQPSSAAFKESTYRRHLQEMFSMHGARMHAITQMLRDWSDAGATIEVVPNTKREFLQASALTSQYMRRYSLTPADAMHLALAEAYASSFVTADAQFRRVASQAPPNGLVIVGLRP